MDTEGGGWTVFHRRISDENSTNYFRKNWKDYSLGFGELDSDFWLGNDKLTAITSQGNYTMRLDREIKGAFVFHNYMDTFKIGDENDRYRLYLTNPYKIYVRNLSGYTNYLNFSTFDSDNDLLQDLNCADVYKYGWWFDGCLNFDVYFQGKGYIDVIKNISLHQYMYKMEAKIRRKPCTN
ncbi:techylectin-5A-like [Centruroides vittatus]|uniref:techylectin-5A-like n=1 Tax=Centruroides vittatus TaxID=120091 RepID=UPI00350F6CE8